MQLHYISPATAQPVSMSFGDAFPSANVIANSLSGFYGRLFFLIDTACSRLAACMRMLVLVLSPPLMISLLFFHSMACCEGRARGRPSAERAHHDVRDRQGGRLALRIKTQPCSCSCSRHRS